MRRLLLLLAAIASPLGAQMAYKQPPPAIAKVLDTPPTPTASFSPDRTRMLMTERNGLPPISDVGAPYLRLAGSRINPRTNGNWRETFARGLVVRPVGGTAETRVRTPAGAKISHVSWADDSKKIVFTVTGADGVKLWTADVATGAAHRVADLALEAIDNPCAWMDVAHLVCQTIPAGRLAAPKAPDIPEGPIVQETDGRKNPAPTFEDLLASPYDEKLFDHYFTSQLAIVGLDGTVAKIGGKGIHSRMSPSPDRRYVIVSTIHRPYSYQVPMQRFPTLTEIWDRSGKVVRKVDDTPLQEGAPRGFDAVEAGPRNVAWRADAPATLYWVEALDAGNPNTQMAKHDRVLMLDAPFTGSPAELVSVETRIGGGRGGGRGGGAGPVTWAKPDLALVGETSRRTRKARMWAVNPSSPSQAPRLLWEHATDDRYSDPGSFELARGPFGENVLRMSKDGRNAYLTGTGSSSEGDRPFLDRYDLATGKSTRLFRSEAPFYENVVAMLDGEGSRVVTLRESVKDVPNYFLRDLAVNTLTRLTAARDPAPEFAGVKKEFVKYKRADGVDLTATVYLPSGYDKARDGPLPFFLWAYPAEFESVQAASQVSGSPYRFTVPTGRLLMLSQGYGVMDNPTIPIIAQNGGKPNDTYVQQLVAGAKAAIDKIVDMGVGDRDRVAVGGHSYGGFMTANLLAHTSFFKAGIAESGAYNRTLTPFGFQNEERTFWEAPDLYMRMSPFAFADSIRTPILLVHGMADDNTGTFPINSERLYAAIKGNGGIVRYVQLPAEPHGYRARESIGHVLAEEVAWLDKYVKPKPKVKAD
jgi:dipeptidyl aminopeptidase/acylaminoacyl peptidase